MPPLNENSILCKFNFISLKKYNIKKNNVAYIGDDINDLEALKYAGLSASPCNSPILEYFTPDFITKRNSGMGAFRDLSDLILKANNIPLIY